MIQPMVAISASLCYPSPQPDDSEINNIKVNRAILTSIIIIVTIIVFLLTGFLVSLITVIIAGVLISGLKQASRAVSYTHLTLPTIYSV